VIVVDDDDDTRGALEMLFTDEGYSVVTVHSGARALETLRHGQCPAVVLFDYLMPEGDGLDLLTAVAADEALQRRYTYVCMTARDRSRMPPDFTALIDRLAVPFVAKPFDVDTLLATIEDAHQRLLPRSGARL
jgi:two-component system, OmpR family, response regulator